MNPFHLLKALFISLLEGFRRSPETSSLPPESAPPRRKERKPLPPAVKWTVAGLLAVVGFALLAIQVRRSLPDQPPSWLKVQTHTSPSLPSTHFKTLREECEREVARHRVPLDSIRLLEISDTNGAAMLWSSEPMINPGFAPITQVDRRFQSRREAWVGYYRLDGTPMRYTQRTNPSQTNALFVSLHLDQPLAPGATQTVLRVNKVNLRFRPNRNGNLEVFQGRFPSSAGVAAAGVALPPNAECVRFAPISGTRKTAEATTFVWWLSTRTESNAQPMSVEFKMK